MPPHYQGTENEKQALDTYVKLMRATESVTARLNALQTHGELSVSQFGTLEALYHLGPMYQKDICKKILKSSGNITMVVDNLEDKGLVERRKDLDDRRYSMVHLTEKGRSTVEKILPGHVQAIQEMLCVLTESEQERLGRLCKKLGLSATEYSETE